MRTSLIAVAASGVVLTAGALLISGVGPAFSVAVGAFLAVGNLWALARVVVAVFPSDEKSQRGPSAWGLVAALKMIAFVAAAWLLMQEGVVSPIPLVVGRGSLPVGIAIGAVVSDRGEA
jgi:hypothetical protein